MPEGDTSFRALLVSHLPALMTDIGSTSGGGAAVAQLLAKAEAQA
jgi:hypothetical protein